MREAMDKFYEVVGALRTLLKGQGCLEAFGFRTIKDSRPMMGDKMCLPDDPPCFDKSRNDPPLLPDNPWWVVFGGYELIHEHKVPSCFRFHTEDRFTFLKTQDAVIALLTELGVPFSHDDWWRWTPERRQVRAFGFFVLSEARRPKIQTVGPRTLCLSTDPRADLAIWDMLRDAGVGHMDMSAAPTEDGYQFSLYRLADVKTIKQAFPDCQFVMTRGEERRHYSLDLKFPDRV